MFCIYLFSMVSSVIGKSEEIYDNDIAEPAGNNQRAQWLKHCLFLFYFISTCFFKEISPDHLLSFLQSNPSSLWKIELCSIGKTFATFIIETLLLLGDKYLNTKSCR